MSKIRSVLCAICVALLSISSAYADSNADKNADKHTDNKVALITGTASGFGKAVAERLIQKGYVVYGGDIDTAGNQYLTKLGGTPLAMDVTSDSQVNAGVERIIKEQGRIDVLVNNAGYGSYGTIEDVPIAEIQHQFDVNVFGYARVQKAVLPQMRKQKSGRIVVVSSVVGVFTAGGIGWYSASKHAVEAMADALALEVYPLGIRVVKIRPGMVNTHFDEVAFEGLKKVKISDDYKPTMERVAGSEAAYQKVEGPDGTADVIVQAIEAPEPKVAYNSTKDSEQYVAMEKSLSEDALQAKLLGISK